jgi:SAM-dependent methyltransferase
MMDNQTFQKMAIEEVSHWWFSGRRILIKEALHKIDLQENALILEVGCGTGGNLKMLSSLGTVYAFEKNNLARFIASAKSHHQIQIKIGSCPNEIPEYENKFDLICLFDVLEHIKEDKKTILKLRKLLAQNGKIVFTVPAYKWLFSRHDRALHHFRRYSRNDILHLIHATNLEIQRITHFNFILAIPVICIRILSKYLNVSNSKKISQLSRFTNLILFKIFSLEKFILNKFNIFFGISILVILKKR